MVFRPVLQISFILAALSGLSAPAWAQEAAPARVTFAGGANTISEGHGDWTLICGVQEGARACVVTQTLGDQRSGQRVVTIEFEATGQGGAEGTLMMPFGLRLADGVKTQVDGVAVGEVAAFSACYETGCMADFSMDGDVMDLLERGNELKLVAIAEDSGENVVLTASLSGFSSATARSLELVR
jgi:invasion protein IalB